MCYGYKLKAPIGFSGFGCNKYRRNDLNFSSKGQYRKFEVSLGKYCSENAEQPVRSKIFYITKKMADVCLKLMI